MTENVAVAHDAYTSDGGAERVATDIARLFDAPIYATRVDEEFCPDDIDVHEMWDSWTSDFWHERKWWLPRTAYWVGRHLYRHERATYAPELKEYDVVIITKGPMRPYVPDPEQTVIRYCHSPPRRHYDLFHEFGGGFMSRMWSLSQRILETPSIRYPDHWIANSDVVAARLQKYYDIDDSNMSVVYPGIDVSNTVRAETQDYYFHVGRLAHNKRIGLLRDVADAIEMPIVVAGTGPEEDTLLDDKPDNVQYLGYIDEREKWQRLAEAKATLFFAEDEDFGIVPIESMAAGTPVVGVDEGFTRYQIKHNKTGRLCNPTVESVTTTIMKFEDRGVAWSEQQIRRYAEQFSKRRFNDELQTTVTEVHEQCRIDPTLSLPEEVSATDD